MPDREPNKALNTYVAVEFWVGALVFILQNLLFTGPFGTAGTAVVIVHVFVGVLAVVVVANAVFCIAAVAIGAVQSLKDHRPKPPHHPAAPAHAGVAGMTPVSRSTPFVSVHVAIHDEPAELVNATLDALGRLDYPAFEVLVIDNNTADPRVWRPVEAHVGRLGGPFRFLHREGVVGAKAGALNIALENANPAAAYVAIVDADYQVRADFLTSAVAACATGASFVQFPQAYRRATGVGFLVSELGDYFRTFPQAANLADASLLTGTLSLISAEALRAAGGWPTTSITEDAALGVNLWRAGSRGLYVDRVVGDGLLPLDLAGLRTQRRRWAAGNMQILLRLMATGAAWAPRGRRAVFGQLTAWAGFMAIPLFALAVAALVQAGQGPDAAWGFIRAVSAATIAATMAGLVLRSLAIARPGVLLVSFAVMWTSSLGWLPAALGLPLRFRRTPKALLRGRWKPSLDLLGSSAAAALAVVFALQGAPITAGVLLLSASGLLTAPFVDRALRRAALSQDGPTCRA